MKISVAQFDVKRGDPTSNLETIDCFAREAATAGSRLLCLPEMATTGFSWSRNRELLPKASGHLAQIASFARSYQIEICGTFLEETEEGKAANALFYIGTDGETLGKYRKIHLFTLFREHDHVEAGNSSVTFDAEVGRVGLGVCYDLRFPELFRKNAELGATIQILPAAFPYPRLDHWRTLLKARAIENQCYFVGINQTGVEGHGEDVGTTHYFGHSMIIDPWGEVVAEGGEGTELLHAEISPEFPAKVRERFPALKDRRPDLF